MNAVTALEPGRAIVTAVQGTAPGTSRSLLAMTALLHAIQASDSKIECFISMAKTL